jgi:hypothetical protein
LGTWPIGLSYGTFHDNALVPLPEGGTRAQTLGIWQFGATVLQTLTPGLLVGSTVKYVRGKATSGSLEGLSASEALEHASKLDGPSSGHLDLDVGAMADLGRARLGLLVRNLREPSFSDHAGTAITLRRHARMGLAVLPAAGVTLAIDLDLDTVDLRDGPRRILAVGGEDRFGHRCALRGGVRRNLKGSRLTVAVIGASLALRPQLWLDGHYTHGHLDADRGFGVALRAGF